jgi:5-oxoprolinase (ATP-hydrolysing)
MVYEIALISMCSVHMTNTVSGFVNRCDQKLIVG